MQPSGLACSTYPMLFMLVGSMLLVQLLSQLRHLLLRLRMGGNGIRQSTCASACDRLCVLACALLVCHLTLGTPQQHSTRSTAHVAHCMCMLHSSVPHCILLSCRRNKGSSHGIMASKVLLHVRTCNLDSLSDW